jgi:Fur family transcriptional regulator, peroxide stress response regulator
MKKMEKALRAAGCRITRQRRAILNYLAATNAHPSARQVYLEARKEYPRLSLATVYNTLDKLVSLGLIKVLDFQIMDNRHETNLAPHLNLICTICGSIQDFEGEMNVNADAIKEKAGFDVEDCRMEYYGVCAECAGRAKKEKT